MADIYCSGCRRTTEVVFNHATCDTVCSGCRPGRLQNPCCDPDQSLILGFRTIVAMSDRLGLVAEIKGRACEILKKTDQLYNKRTDKDAVLAACLYIACQLEDSPCTAKEICSVANGVTKKEISLARSHVLQESGSFSEGAFAPISV